MSFVVWASIGLLAVTVLLGLLRVATATDAASRAVVGDLIFFCAVGIMVLLGMLVESAVVVVAAMLAAILGILATVALSRILTRGGR